MAKAPTKPPAAPRSERSTARAGKRAPLPRYSENDERQLAATIGAVARQARKRAGYTQADMAEAMGTHTEVYGRIERGLLVPRVAKLLHVCRILGIGPQELMGFTPLGPAQSIPEASTLPPGVNDTPEKRLLLRRLACLDRPRVKALARLATLLLPGK
jgi:transcriptional regulator with XRE-family HTH domain